MQLKTLRAKNFMSFSDISLSLEQGLCLIGGFNYDDMNSNGSGKTSVMDAITYCIYGEIPRSVKVNEIANRYKSGKCQVELSLNCQGKEISIVRSRNPIDLYITVNGIEKRGKDAKETQQMIEDIIGIDLKIFLNSIYFNQDNKMQFVTASDPDKKKILTDLLDLEIFDKAYSYSHEKIKQLKEDIKLLQSKYEMCNQTVNTLSEEVNALQQKSDNFEQDKDNKIKLLCDETTKLNVNIEQLSYNIEQKQKTIDENSNIPDQLKQLNEQLVQLDELNDRVKELEYEKQTCINNMKQIDNQIKSLGKMENTVCSQCNQQITEVYVSGEIKHLKEKIKPYVIQYEDNVNRTDKLNLQILDLLGLKKKKEELEQKQKSIDSIKNEILRLKDNINHQRELMQRNSQEINNLHNVKNNFKEILEGKSVSLSRQKQQLNEIKDIWADSESKLQKYIIIKSSYMSVKYYVFENVVEELNINIDKYLQPLFDSDISVRFSAQSENDKGEIKQKFSTSIIKSNKNCSFNSLSDGEKRRVEIATNFALSDIVSNRSKNSFNFMFLDEILSGALSKDGAERVVEVLKTLKGDKHIFIVDHNNFVQDLIDNKIFVEKRDNISGIKEEK